MTDITTVGPIRPIEDAMDAVRDRSIPFESRVALYATLHQIQLRINRALRAAKDDLIVHMESNGLRDMGPLSIKATGIDVKWPCNDEDNWTDITTQEQLALFAKIAPEYIRHVPDHLEVRTAELGAGVAEGDPVAKTLHSELKRLRYRTEEGRRLSLAVREAKPTPKKEAA